MAVYELGASGAMIILQGGLALLATALVVQHILKRVRRK